MNSTIGHHSLLLIRHSAVHIDQNRPAKEWSLSVTGRHRCQQFASQLSAYQPSLFISSIEKKAVETATLIARELEVAVISAPNLHEHDREGMPFFDSPEAFRSNVHRFFSNPDQLVFGRETAAEAGSRINSAIIDLIGQNPGANLAIVSHGTVLTLFVCRHNPHLDPMTFWQNLQMPCAVILRQPDLSLQKLLLVSS